jgi:hypothetical protein
MDVPLKSPSGAPGARFASKRGLEQTFPMSPTDAAPVLAEFRPGLEIYLQGAGGEPLALGPILAGAWAEMKRRL